jgi:hypothetical protein
MTIRVSFEAPVGKQVPGYTITYDGRGKVSLERMDRKQVVIQVDEHLHNAFCFTVPLSEFKLPEWLSEMKPLKAMIKEKLHCDTLVTGWYCFYPYPSSEQVTCEVTSLPGARISVIVNGVTPRAVLLAYKAVLTGDVRPVKPYKRAMSRDSTSLPTQIGSQ